jgi:hypothetical protein
MEKIVPLNYNIIYLYYKERKQLRTFLTQIGSVLPLTPDPLFIFFYVDKVEGLWSTENRNLESVSAKNVILLLPTVCLPTHLRVPVLKKIPFPAVETSPAAISSAQRVHRRPALLVGGPPDQS